MFDNEGDMIRIGGWFYIIVVVAGERNNRIKRDELWLPRGGESKFWSYSNHTTRPHDKHIIKQPNDQTIKTFKQQHNSRNGN